MCEVYFLILIAFVLLFNINIVWMCEVYFSILISFFLLYNILLNFLSLSCCFFLLFL